MNVVLSQYDGDYFSVQFTDGFSSEVLSAVRKVSGRVWNNEKKLWLIPDRQAVSFHRDRKPGCRSQAAP